MKRQTIIYWTTTSILSLMMLFSAYAYLTADAMQAAFGHLGFPAYFRIELAIAKALGVVALLTPAIKGRAKEWAYAGFFIVFVSAFIAHAASGDGAGKWIAPLIMLGLLFASYFSYHRLQAGKQS